MPAGLLALRVSGNSHVEPGAPSLPMRHGGTMPSGAAASALVKPQTCWCRGNVASSAGGSANADQAGQLAQRLGRSGAYALHQARRHPLAPFTLPPTRFRRRDLGIRASSRSNGQCAPVHVRPAVGETLTRIVRNATPTTTCPRRPLQACLTPRGLTLLVAGTPGSSSKSHQSSTRPYPARHRQ